MDEPQPGKSIAIQRKWGESSDMSWEKVLDEPPQKCRNISVGDEVPEIVTLMVVEGVRVMAFVLILVCDIIVYDGIVDLEKSEL